MHDDDFELDSRQLGSLPITNAFVDRLGLSGLLETFLPHNDRRLKLAPATAIGVVVRNLVIRLYATKRGDRFLRLAAG